MGGCRLQLVDNMIIENHGLIRIKIDFACRWIWQRWQRNKKKSKVIVSNIQLATAETQCLLCTGKLYDMFFGLFERLLSCIIITFSASNRLICADKFCCCSSSFLIFFHIFFFCGDCKNIHDTTIDGFGSWPFALSTIVCIFCMDFLVIFGPREIAHPNPSRSRHICMIYLHYIYVRVWFALKIIAKSQVWATMIYILALFKSYRP